MKSIRNVLIGAALVTVALIAVGSSRRSGRTGPAPPAGAWTSNTGTRATGPAPACCASRCRH